MKIEFNKYGDATIEFFIQHNDGFNVCSKDNVSTGNSVYKVELKITNEFFDIIKTTYDGYTESCIDDYIDYLNSLDFYSRDIAEYFDYEWTATSIEQNPHDSCTYSCHQRNWREPIFNYQGKHGKSFYGDNILRVAGIYHCIEQYIENDIYIYYAKKHFAECKK